MSSIEIVEMKSTTLEIPTVKYTGPEDGTDECLAEVAGIEVDCHGIGCGHCAFDPRNFPKLMSVFAE